MARIFPFFFILLASSCATTSCWELDELAAGNRAYDSSRLKYADSSSSLEFEMLRVGENIETFVSLKRNRFSSASGSDGLVKASFKWDGDPFDEEIPLREGAMRIRLPLETAKRITQALQEGKNVSILIDGYEQTLEADRFSNAFSQFLGKRYQEDHLFKGHIQ